jgi:AraC family transcriptional regulator of adaptative response/methylated-DNA-[protein]-cysteine methyltransferase
MHYWIPACAGMTIGAEWRNNRIDRFASMPKLATMDMNIAPTDKLVRAAIALIDEADETQPTLNDLGAKLGVSPFHLQRTFKKALGVSPREYAEATRLDRFKMAVRAGGTVAGALYEAGYGSSSRLYESASRRLGMTPASYGKGGKGAEIAYAIVPCELGRLLVAATAIGVCRIAFGDDDAALADLLHHEFPEADIADGANEIEDLAIAVASLVDNADQRLTELPLDVQCSAFQAQVWQQLRSIPQGETRSYADIAKAVGQPNASRAVARACANNAVAVTVPCHRVIGSDGKLHGYRWGLARKKRLLAKEGVAVK